MILSTEQILERAHYWASSEVFDNKTRTEVRDLIEGGQIQELEERFYRDLDFGTGGLRGIVGAGTARMNIYNIRKAACAVARHCRSEFGDANLKVALTYDSRLSSRTFAQASAEVWAAEGFTVYITKELRPVPMLSFMLRHFGCHAGACITASHNPPQYNGFKVYWQSGGQVVPPHDKAIIAVYNSIQDYAEIGSLNYQQAIKLGKIVEVGSEVDQLYFDQVASLSLRNEGRKHFKIVFTPLHGTAAYPVSTCLQRFGFDDVTIVPEQAQPDGNFPTVKFPNPEDPDALKMAVELAQKIDADLVLGTDPDCDRIGIVVKEGDRYLFLNGNQIGSLLMEYYLSSLKDTGRMPLAPMVIKTIVTTDLQNHIGAYYGAQVEETLTGFKWICQVIEEYENGTRTPYREYVCGGEESYGFLAGHFVRDKDGVIACCIAAEMVAYYKSQGKTLTQVLDQVFRRHGVYQEKLINLVLPGKKGAEQIESMMKRLRQDPPLTIAGKKVTAIRDIQAGHEIVYDNLGNSQSKGLTLPSSNVLQFFLDDGSKVSARPSGTEPKIKFYISVREDIDSNISDQQLQGTKDRCLEQIDRIEKEFVALAQG